MNPLIKKELEKVKYANLPEYDDGTTEMLIRSGKRDINIELQLNHCYRIVVEDYILKPFDGFSLHENWNKGIAPVDKIMNIRVLQFMGKMVRVSAIGASNIPWAGWLPRKSFQTEEEIAG